MDFFKLFCVFIISFFVSLASVVPMRCASVSAGAIDIPSDNRRMHTRPVARGGGVAVFSAFAVANMFFSLGRLSLVSGAVLAGGALMAALGFCDDISSLSPKSKLLAQAFICAIPLFFGIRADAFSLFGGFFALPLPLSVVFSFLWVLALTNALNLIDGLDGLASGVTAICGIALAIHSLRAQDIQGCALSISLTGAALGFLPYNKHKAKMFLGDAGSLSLGYILAVLSLYSLSGTVAGEKPSAEHGLSLLALFLLFAYPILDLLLAVVRRLKNRRSIFAADKQHIHHKLLTRGFSHTEAVGLLLAVTALCCALSLWV